MENVGVIMSAKANERECDVCTCVEETVKERERERERE